MDIQATLNKPIPSASFNKNNFVNNKVQFQEFITKETKKEISSKLTDLMNAIDEQAQKLSQNQSIDNLKKYKKQVKEFMSYVKQNAVKLENNEEFSGFGHSKTLQIIRKVDKKLIDLTEQVLQKEGNSGLRVLELIGEVKGLLIDISV